MQRNPNPALPGPPPSGAVIRNPVLPGFNADPSILRADGAYWIAASTFEWWPGAALYRSENLVDWKLVRNILDRPELLDLRGVGDSCGIWAPHLSFREADGLWYLAFTVVSGLSDSFFDLKNYVATAADPLGVWSKPIYVNSVGFDPALFHEDDGSSWLVGLAWEFRKGYKHPGDIVVRRFDAAARRPMGPRTVISRGNPRFGCTEGPQIFKRDGWYYLLTAEGGTGYGHAVLVYRSRSVAGPYEPCPHGPLITSRADPFPADDDPDPDFLKERFFNPGAELQKAGHGCLVDTPGGETYLAFLCARPVGEERRCILNRETALERVEWEDGWPRPASGDPRPRRIVPAPKEYRSADSAALPRKPNTSDPVPADAWANADVTSPGRDSFEDPGLPPRWYALRCPIDESWCSLSRRPGALAIRGRNSFYDRLETSLIARRVQHFAFHAETRMHFLPENERQMAGLVLMNGSGTWYFLRLYRSESLGGAALGIMTSDLGRPDELLDSRVLLPEDAAASPEGIRLAVDFAVEGLRFSWGPESGNRPAAAAPLRPIGPPLDATKLSDEYNNSGRGAFSGTFIGMGVLDLDRQESWAAFDSFDYLPAWNRAAGPESTPDGYERKKDETWHTN